jgi:hypothetical protein
MRNVDRLVASLVAATLLMVPPPVYAGWKTKLFVAAGATGVFGLAGSAAIAKRRAACDPKNPPRVVQTFVAELPAILNLAEVTQTLYSFHDEPVTYGGTKNVWLGSWDTKQGEYREYQETPWGLGYLVWEDNKNRNLVIAFRGTDFGLAKDVFVDLDQWLGGNPDYYAEALVLIDQRTSMPRFKGYNVVLTGHSLGGGVATYAGLVYGYKTVAFNSARLSSGALEQAVVANRSVYRMAEVGSTFLDIRLEHDEEGFTEITQVRNYFDPISGSLPPQDHTVSMGAKFMFFGIEGPNVHGMRNLWRQIGSEDQIMSTLSTPAKKFARACNLYYGMNPHI